MRTNAAWQLAERVVAGGLSFVTSALVARHLGPDAYGLLTYAVALVALIASPAGLGLETLAVRDLVAEPERAAIIWGNSAALRLMAGALVIAIGLPLAAITASADMSFTVACAAIGAGLQASEALEWRFTAGNRFSGFVLPRMAAGAVSALLRVAMVAAGATVRWFASMLAIESGIRAIALAIWSRRAGHSLLPQRVMRAEFIALLRRGLPLGLAASAITVYMRIDQVMLGVLLGKRDVGLYGAVATLSEAWYLIPLALGRAAAPQIAAMAKGKRQEYEFEIVRLFRVTGAIHVAVALAVTFGSSLILRLVYGVDFVPAAAALVVHIWTGIFVSLGVISSLWLINEGLQRFMLMRTVTGCVCNIALNLVLIPRLGIMGAAVATLIAQCTSAWLMDLSHARTRRMFWLKLQALLPMIFKEAS